MLLQSLRKERDARAATVQHESIGARRLELVLQHYEAMRLENGRLRDALRLQRAEAAECLQQQGGMSSTDRAEMRDEINTLKSQVERLQTRLSSLQTKYDESKRHGAVQVKVLHAMQAKLRNDRGELQQEVQKDEKKLRRMQSQNEMEAHNHRRIAASAKFVQRMSRRQVKKELEKEAALVKELEGSRMNAAVEKSMVAAKVANSIRELNESTSESDQAKALRDGSKGRLTIAKSGQPLAMFLQQTMRFLLRNTEKGKALSHSTSTKFFSPDGVAVLNLGKPAQAAHGLEACLTIDSSTLHGLQARGTAAIVDEYEKYGTEIDQECLEYVLRAHAGSSELIFCNSPYPRDRDDKGVRKDRCRADGSGMLLEDFVLHELSQKAKLEEPHVLALRLYTTAAFESLNAKLRRRPEGTAHPLAATVAFLTEGIKRLRALDESNGPFDLWRGMRNLESSEEFERDGGCELGLMSTTSDLEVAARYALSETSLLFKIDASQFLDRGANVSFLSAFANESEYLYPPLTYLKPTGRREVVTSLPSSSSARAAPKLEITVIEVRPNFG